MSKKEKILVTGGCGFIGSNLLTYLENYPELSIVNLDLLTYAGKPENVAHLDRYQDRYEFIKGDICDGSLLKEIFSGHTITGVMHLAAESHVDNSLERPADFCANKRARHLAIASRGMAELVCCTLHSKGRL